MFKKKKIWIVTLTLAAVISLPVYLAAGEMDNLLQNGSFETYSKNPDIWIFPGRVDLNLDVGNTEIANWTVIKGMIDYFGLCPEDPRLPVPAPAVSARRSALSLAKHIEFNSTCPAVR